MLFGFAAATLAAAVLHAPPARAQERTEQPQANSRLRTTDLRTRETDPATAYETPMKTPRLRGTEDDFGNDAANETREEDDDEQQDPNAATSPTDEPMDGDIARDGSVASDGIIDLAEPQERSDGADPTQDMRPPEDSDLFVNPPAGYDPLLFQIEDIDPAVTDRRPTRLARFEPYDPIGIRVGSFVFFPEAEIAGLWTDNVLSSPDAHADIAAEIATKSRLVSNWSVHALELRGTTLSSFYDEFPSEDDRAWGLEARGRLDISRRTNFQGLVGHDYSQESRSAIDANLVGERANVTVDRAELAFNHRFNRLSTQLRGSVADSTYSDTNGVSNRDRDTLETQQAVRASWEFKPTLSVFGDQELNQRNKRAVPPDGISRDSTGSRTRVGLDFGSTGAVLRGTISVGYGVQDPDDHRLKEVDAFLFDANLAWRPSEITSFLLLARSDIYETTTQDSGGVIAHTVGFEARHALRRYLIASAGLSYTHYDYDATPVTESELVSSAGLEYYASPELVLFARYQHLNFDSNDLDGDYQSDEVRAGVRIRK
jgi:hypothetical protein